METTDQEFLNDLYRDSRADLADMPMPPSVVQQMIKMQQMSQAQGIQSAYPKALSWLILRHADSVGRIVVDVGESTIRLIDIAVMSGWRQRGIATQILHGLQVLASAESKSMCLAVQCNNLGARRIYQRAGFTVCSSDGLFDQMTWNPNDLPR